VIGEDIDLLLARVHEGADALLVSPAATRVDGPVRQSHIRLRHVLAALRQLLLQVTILTTAHLGLGHDVGLQPVETLTLVCAHLLQAHLLRGVALLGESHSLLLQHHVAPAEAALNGVIQLFDETVDERVIRAGDARADTIVIAHRATHFGLRPEGPAPTF